ncbi:hypothetical protein [uncultured Tateyamaria sp.]|uniref:hypothetical protein n=1 Tax=uncultured Tateyamaria sp. TaxID=455651 RepID=UPI002623BC02|nr:hypothetical protein [uncultured Tateyamaria sp.]
MRTRFLLLLPFALAACADPAIQDDHAMTLPPIGLAATAVWLDEREANTPRPTRASDIPTSQIRATVNGGVAATPVAQPVPNRAAPSGNIALATQAFADVCVASLPTMAGIKDRFDQVSLRDFGVRPSRAASNYYITGQRRGDIYMNLSLGAGRSNIQQCAISVRRQDAATVAQTLVDTVTNAGYALSPVAASGTAQQAWAISGAPAGTQLKTSTRINALGQELTGVWITWR